MVEVFLTAELCLRLSGKNKVTRENNFL